MNFIYYFPLLPRALHLLPPALLCALAVAPAEGHHSFAGTFTDELIEVTGVVSNMHFRNPHLLINFDVANADGTVTEWTGEGLSATLLRRFGWARDELKAGDIIRISGSSTRDGSPMVGIREESRIAVLAADGAELRRWRFIRDERFNWVAIIEADGQETRLTTGSSGTSEPGKAATLPPRLPDGLPNLSGTFTQGPAGADHGGRGAGDSPETRHAEPTFTDLGQALFSAFDPADDPQVHCEPVGLVRQAGFTPHPVKVEQFADRVVFDYEEYGNQRVVMLGGEPPQEGDPSSFGDYRAYYEDDALVIESMNLLANPATPTGIPLSGQTATVERYRRMDDPEMGSALFLEMTITDPLHLEQPWTLTWRKWAEAEYEMIESVCTAPL